MEVLDSIEKRIDTLNRILGPLPEEDDKDKGGENFVDSLLSANTLISSAMSGRENIAKIVNRSNELEKYLDPNFHDEYQQVKSKEVYVNATAPDLAGSFEILDKIKELESTLGAEYFRNIPDATDKLKEMSDAAVDLSQTNDNLEESLIIVMKRYSEIQNNINESIRVMNAKLDNIEERIQQKKKLND